MAGIVVPNLLLPIALFTAWKFGAEQLFQIGFLHFVPLIWGIWNVLYFALFKRICRADKSRRLWTVGGLLGLLTAIYGVFWLHIPSIIGLPESLTYLPLIAVPLIYGFLWRFIVKALNDLLGLQDD